MEGVGGEMGGSMKLRSAFMRLIEVGKKLGGALSKLAGGAAEALLLFSG